MMTMVVTTFVGRNNDNLGTNNPRLDQFVPWENARDDLRVNFYHFLCWLCDLPHCCLDDFRDFLGFFVGCFVMNWCLDDCFGDDSLCNDRFDGDFDGFDWFWCWQNQFVVWFGSRLNQFVVRCWLNQFVVW